MDLFIDDQNLGGLTDWDAIYEMVHNGWSYERHISEMHGVKQTENVSFFS